MGTAGVECVGAQMGWATKPKRLTPTRRNLQGNVFKVALWASVSVIALTATAYANPQGGEVVAGDATISTPTPTNTTITQQSDTAIINWRSFNIAPDESTVFVQPNASSITLNRIFDANPSVIAGLVTANGRLILVNRNGMVFERGSVIDTAGLVATTADISDSNFLAGRYQFDQPGSANAQIVNAGTITAKPGGLVAIVAPTVENSGLITAKLGRIGLGAGSTFVLDLQGHDLVSFPISEELARQLTGVAQGDLDGASVVLSSNAARSVIDNVLKLPGDSIANNIKRDGDSVWLTAPQPWMSVQGSAGGTVTAGGTLDVSGATGGSIALTGDNVHATGVLNANGTTGAGGRVSMAAASFGTVSGTISANGASGGSVVVGARNLISSGTVEANGAGGAGGSVALVAANQQIATSSTHVSANGATKGGTIDVAGGTGVNQSLFTSGTYTATASNGTGGTVNVAGRTIKMIDSTVDVSGTTGGGKIAVGFTGEGAGRAINADNVLVSPSSTFHADATQNGNGGSVIFWSNLTSDFMGTITAKGGSLGGNGGFLEVSSKGDIGFWGLGDASAANGLAGSLSLDPKNLIIAAGGSNLPGYQLVDPGSGSTTFGAAVAMLSTGNTVVTASGDDTAATGAGAFFVFNTATGALISMITGSRAGDAVGSGGITVLSNGNFVVASSNWDNGAALVDAGAVTFGSGTTGVAGVVSAANSLVGGASGNQVGNGGVTALSNGNYVVTSTNWDNGATADVGAVTWGNGTSGTFGAVSAANSLIGSTAGDNLGSGGIVALTNGNYVVRSNLWDNGATADVGAVTWGNGSGGTAGSVSAANSLIGVTAGDQVGSSGVTALNNGNYVVASSLWNNGAAADAGAVTWANGSGGTVGTVSAANSLVGTAAGNEVGNGGVTALSNGNYVAISSNWDNGATANVGAVTWGNGATGTVGSVGAANSLIGTLANNNVGSGGVTALTNGNYVVISPNWDTAALTDVGAVTWRNGSAASSGTVAAANSLVGSRANDNVGIGGVTALTNGNYVVSSPNWDLSAAISDSGAATWGNGTTGVSGAITAANSLVGSSTSDNVSSNGIIALTNGNYVVVSPFWDNGAIGSAGAVTWGNGATGIVGSISAANSLVGSTVSDQVGSAGVAALTNGNYAVASPFWNNGAIADGGAATWANGATGLTGTINAGNSLVGTVASDRIGSGGIVALANGNYVVSSELWDNGATTDAGAVTVGIGLGGTVGTVTTANSLIGTLDAELAFSAASPFGEIVAVGIDAPLVLVGLTDPSQFTFARAAGDTLTVGANFITNTLNTGTAVVLQASNDLTVGADVIANNPLGNGGALTLQAGRSVLINADITTDGGNLTIVANELLSAGVINAQRDAGAAVLNMGVGADINAGTGNVRLTLASGAGKTNATSGDMTLRNVTGGTIIAENMGPTNGNVVLASGALTANGTGSPLVVAAQGGNFINNAGAGALSAPNGRWLVYSQNPAANTLGGLAANPYYNTPYNPLNPTGVAGAGNRFAYTVAPVLTVTPNNAARVYGDADPAFTYGITGLINGDLLASAVSGAPLITSTATASSTVAGGPYAINAALGSLASDFNYGFAFGSAALTINAATLTYVADPKSRFYGDANPALTGTVTGFKNGETVATATTGALAWNTPATNTSNVGSYAINGSGLTANSGNYVFVQAAGNATALTINQAQLAYTADAKTRLYGDANPALTGTVTGFKNTDTLGTTTTGTATFTTAATTASNVGSYAINGSGLTLTNANYVLVQAASNATALTINPATLIYTADGKTRLYGDANPALTGTVSGFKNGETQGTATTGALAFTTTANGTTNVGSYAIDGSGLTANNGNYVFAQAASNATALTINPSTLTYLATPSSRGYGDANPAFTGVVNGFKNGETVGTATSGTLTWTSPATLTSNVGTYAINGSGLTANNGNYVFVQDGANATALTINPAQLAYLADPKNRIYGDANPALTGTVTGFKNSDTLATTTTGTATFTTAATTASNVGSYAINGSGLTLTNANYVLVQAASNATALTINPATLTYTADGKSRIYGDANPALTGNVSGFKNGETQGTATTGTLAFNTAATNTTNVGSYAIDGSGLTANNGNYVFVQAASNATALTINPATLTYVADPGTRLYGDANPTFTGTVSGFKNSETIGTATTGTLTFTSPATATSNVGAYAINGSGLTANNGNYVFVQDPGNATALTINPATLTYIADTKTRLYGDANPALTGTVGGFKNGETVATATTGSLTFTTTATNTTNVGSYAIDGSGLTANNGNYVFAQAAGNATALTINPSTLTYVADAKSRIYGDANPTLTGTVTGFKNGETEATATTGALAFSTTATNTSNVGGYAIDGSGLTANNGNYVFVQAGSNATALTINPATLTYIADASARLYGDANPTFTGTVTGFKNGETEATATTGTLGFTSPATATSNVGSYAINGSGLTANNGNYVFVQDAANATALTINAATLTYIADPKSRGYGDANPALTGSVTGFKNGETVGTATTGALTFTTAANNTSNVGTYAINGSGLTANNGNYVFVQDVSNATALTINPASLTYIADTKTRLYGDANPALTGTVGGFKNGDTVATTTTGTLTWSTTATNTSNVGNYAITGSGLTLTNANYVLTQAAGNATALHINPATLLYDADSQARLYGEENPTLTGVVTGFKNGETQATATTGTLTWTTAASETTFPGSYAITGSGLTANNGNYVFAQDPGNATALLIAPNFSALTGINLTQLLKEGDLAGDGVFEHIQGSLSTHENAIDIEGPGRPEDKDGKIDAPSTRCALPSTAARQPGDCN